MKTILCYGDSNTWGAIPGTNERFSIHDRWPGVMRDKLGKDFFVIEEGLCGRTTVWIDQVKPYRKGDDYLLPCLETHAPLDLIIIMLGTNDLKTRFHLPASDIVKGMGVLVERALNSKTGPGGREPHVLLVAPPAIIRVAENEEQFVDGEARSEQFGKLYHQLADDQGVAFFDAGQHVISSLVDGIHLDIGEHHMLGKRIADRVVELLGG